MLKKISIILSACALVVILTGCRNRIEDEEPEYVYNDEYPEESEPTPEEIRAEFELFFEENKEAIIASIATEGEDVRLEIADGYEFVMTILLDDVELNNQNRAIEALTLELSFSQMVIFNEAAERIKEDAGLEHFRLMVVFIDINEVEIVRSAFYPRVEVD